MLFGNVRDDAARASYSVQRRYGFNGRFVGCGSNAIPIGSSSELPLMVTLGVGLPLDPSWLVVNSTTKGGFASTLIRA